MADPVKISFDQSKAAFQGDPEYLTGLLLDYEGNFVKFLQRENYPHRSSETTVTNIAGDLSPVLILLKPGELVSGQYEVIPYINIQQKDLPEGLLQSIGENVTNYSADFLKIPFKIKNNKFQI